MYMNVFVCLDGENKYIFKERWLGNINFFWRIIDRPRVVLVIHFIVRHFDLRSDFSIII